MLWKDLCKFFYSMQGRLEDKDNEGWKGYDTMDEEQLLERLKANVENKSWVDVANYAFFLWLRFMERRRGKK